MHVRSTSSPSVFFHPSCPLLCFCCLHSACCSLLLLSLHLNPFCFSHLFFFPPQLNVLSPSIPDASHWLSSISICSIAHLPIPSVNGLSVLSHCLLGLRCHQHSRVHLLYRTLSHFAFCKINILPSMSAVPPILLQINFYCLVFFVSYLCLIYC